MTEEEIKLFSDEIEKGNKPRITGEFNRNTGEYQIRICFVKTFDDNQLLYEKVRSQVAELWNQDIINKGTMVQMIQLRINKLRKDISKNLMGIECVELALTELECLKVELLNHRGNQK